MACQSCTTRLLIRVSSPSPYLIMNPSRRPGNGGGRQKKERKIDSLSPLACSGPGTPPWELGKKRRRMVRLVPAPHLLLDTSAHCPHPLHVTLALTYRPSHSQSLPSSLCQRRHSMQNTRASHGCFTHPCTDGIYLFQHRTPTHFRGSANPVAFAT